MTWRAPQDAAGLPGFTRPSPKRVRVEFRATPATIPRMLKLLIVVVRALTLARRGHRELVLENLALREQLAAFHRTTRCRLRARDRLFWMALARCWRNWRTALIVVQPDTVIRWHRGWLRRRWTRRSRPRHDGRPQVDQQIRTLVRQMATANPLWGAPRIHGELRTLGVHVSERMVSRLLEPHTRPSPQTWKTFLSNHLASAASMDFFTVPTLTGRVLFVVIVLSHVRRCIVHFNITEHPTAEWTAPSESDASWAREGRPRSSTSLGNVHWAHHRDSRSGRPSSPIRTAGSTSGTPVDTQKLDIGVRRHASHTARFRSIDRTISGADVTYTVIRNMHRPYQGQSVSPVNVGAVLANDRVGSARQVVCRNRLSE
jgi:hypothetical protein